MNNSENDIKVDIKVEFINAEMNCIACGNMSMTNDNKIGDDFQTINIDKGVFERYRCLNCGCNTFDIECYTRIKLT